jgi:predicted nucleic acid-binding protein
MPLMGKLFARQTRRLDRRGGYARGLRMTPPERLTIDATVAFDFLDPEAERHEHATALFELAERGEVELATAPQGYRLDLTRGRSDKQLREAFEREEVRATRQVARVSEVTYPGADLIVGHYVQGFAEAWDRIAENWPRAPGPADRLHVETHIVEGRDVFITDDKRLLAMCRRLNENGFSIVAMPIAEFLAERRAGEP